MTSTVRGVKIHIRPPIPEDCNQIDIYNDLKRDLQELYAGATVPHGFRSIFKASEQNSGIWQLN